MSSSSSVESINGLKVGQFQTFSLILTKLFVPPAAQAVKNAQGHKTCTKTLFVKFRFTTNGMV